MTESGETYWVISYGSETVRMEMFGRHTGRRIAWCEFPPEIGYELAQTITLNCIKSEEEKKKADG